MPLESKLDRETYTALEAFIAEKGYAPTVRELGSILGLSSTSSTQRRLDSLVASGVVERIGPGRLILKGTE